MARSSSITWSELSKIPFINKEGIRGRVLTTLTFFENGEWHLWLPLPSGLQRIKGEPAESDYFGRSPERDTDIYLEFLNFMTQRACWEHAMKPIDGIRNDIHNLGASLGKLELFHQTCANTQPEVRRFASTEIEYIFGVCRGFFDLLQEVISALWQTIELHDKNIKKRQLPKSFRKIVLRNEQLRSVEAIQTEFRIPVELASFYRRHASFFQVLRRYRDDVVHRGRDFSSIFVTEKGFAVSADMEPFRSFGVWNEEHMLRNRLASLRPVVAHVITETLRACEDFAETIQAIIRFPPEIAPGFRLFLRGYHDRQLHTMGDVIESCKWWTEEK